MTPLPVNPRVVVLVSPNGVVKVASNIAPLPELDVVVTNNPAIFEQEALGKPFNQEVVKP